MDVNWVQVFLLIILTGAFVLLLTERIRIDLTAVLIIIALAITGVLTPEEALSGFSSEPAIVAAAVFVLSGALYYTGLSDRLGKIIGRLAGQKQNRMVAVIMLAVAALSAFTHHLTMTAVMLPVTLKLSQDHDVTPSKLLMPMSLAASLGTTITILGAPAFLIAHLLLKQSGRPGLGIFSIAPIGLAISAAGTLFILVFGRYLLPERKGSSGNVDQSQMDGYYTELLVAEDSVFVGQPFQKLEAKADSRFQIVSWLRHGRLRQRPYQHKRLKANDVLLVRTTPDELATLQQEPGLTLHPIVKYKNNENGDDNGAKQEKKHDETERFIQAVVAPNSELNGRTIGQINFLQQYDLIVVGIWRRKGWLRAELSRVRLRPGDVLLLMGSDDGFSRLAQDRSFLMLVPFHGEPFMRHKASLAGLIMLGSILAAALGLMAIEIAMLAGAAAVVLTRCLTPPQAYRTIDSRIYVFIAGAIPLGLAMETSGTADLLAGWLGRGVGGLPETAVLLILFLAAAVVTQLMSDAGTVALLGPVAIALARTLGHPAEPYVVTVAVAAVASFLTPIGHHGNLLIYGPGGYHFSDFLKVGTPLTLLVALLTTILAQMLWPG
jgi:di/tricarboxylate transporter